MTNIWDVFYQSLTLSVAAALILLVKAIFRDQLSPRWQYGVWGIFALRAIIPILPGRGIFPYLPLWLEFARGAVESTMNSAYTDVFVPASVNFPLPFISGLPSSLTDYLMIAYVLGVFAAALWHGLGYLRLRRLVGRGAPLSEENREIIGTVCEKYGLSACPAVEIEGLKSAFVCGVLRPVLVLPAGEAPDEKIILHELLHFRHRDALQSVFWCALKCLNWWNVFLYGVFNRIGNDMESLCDQRVLERLEGEERRRYGEILLAMASEKYARSVGTSSISNGGDNISRRIEAIVRFKKYPRGMAFVSVCIVLILAMPVLAGGENSYDSQRFESCGGANEIMARCRLNRCGSPAGALDTYAKGLINGSWEFIAMSSPFERHEEIHNALASGQRQIPESRDGMIACALLGNTNPGYTVYNLRETGDGLEGIIAININNLPAGSGRLVFSHEELSDPNFVAGKVLVPVRVFREAGSWVVEETGEWTLIEPEIRDLGSVIAPETPAWRQLESEGEVGTVKLMLWQISKVDNMVTSSGTGLFASSQSYFDAYTLKRNAEFSEEYTEWAVAYEYNGCLGTPIARVGIYCAPASAFDESDFKKIDFSYINGAGSISNGTYWESNLKMDGNVCIMRGRYGVLDEAYEVRVVLNGVNEYAYRLSEEGK